MIKTNLRKHLGLVLLSVLLMGCNPDDGDDGRNGTDGLDGESGVSSLIEQTVLPAGDDHCPAGGLLISSGADLNHDGLLDEMEVEQRNAVCDGSPESILDPALVAQGQEIFRHDTFGDETLWTDTLRMHEVIEQAVTPAVALGVGLKVDAEMLPEGLLATANLDDPATTVALLKLGAVVGLEATVTEINGVDRLTSIGTTCALCHSTVDDSVTSGIGKRLDGWPNRDLDPGLILSLSPAMQDPETQSVLTSWGPGKYDAYWNQDGQNNPAVIPPAWGLNGIHLATFTGEGDISYWNAYVAVTQMGGQGNFTDDRLGIDIQVEDDLVTAKLPALRHYQWSLLPPKQSPDAYDAEAAGRGKQLFEGEAQCASCHTGTRFTDANFKLHTPQENGMDATLANRATTGMYRTTPLAGSWQHPPYFHDGSAETLADVVDHYNSYLGLGLTDEQASDLTEYLKSL